MIVDPDFPDHPKTIRLQRALGPQAPMILLRLWGHCQHRKTDVLGNDPEDLAAICRWEGKAKVLVTALLTCRWLDETSDGWVAHGWRAYNQSWLSRIEGGKLRAASASRAKNGQLVTSALPATDQLAGYEQVSLPQLAGVIAGAEERRGEEMRREQPPIRAGALMGGAEALSKTSALCLLIFGKKRSRLGAEAENALSRHVQDLPLSPESEAILQRFYALPPNDLDPDLKFRHRDADKLAQNLFAAVERANAYFLRVGGPVEKKAPVDLESFRTWFASTHPEKPLPASVDQVPDYLLSDFRTQTQTA